MSETGQYFTYDHEWGKLEFWDTLFESLHRLRMFKAEIEEIEKDTQEETGTTESIWRPWPVMTIGRKEDGKLRMQERHRRRKGAWAADAVRGKYLDLPGVEL